MRLALEHGAIVGGIAFELYPRSRSGLLTYMVVAQAARSRELGERLFRGAADELRARGARAVLGEVHVYTVCEGHTRDAPFTGGS